MTVEYFDVMNAGRLTINPVKHIDTFGSIIFPLLQLVLLGAPLIGWAKPVPYNPFRLRDPRRGAVLIGAAGPLSNLGLAIVFSVFLRLVVLLVSGPAGISLATFLNRVVILNISLGVFNLLPLPPLDGSGILVALLSRSAPAFSEFYARYGLFLLVAFIVAGFPFLNRLIELVHRLLLWGI